MYISAFSSMLPDDASHSWSRCWPPADRFRGYQRYFAFIIVGTFAAATTSAVSRLRAQARSLQTAQARQARAV